MLKILMIKSKKIKKFAKSLIITKIDNLIKNSFDNKQKALKIIQIIISRIIFEKILNFKLI